MPTQNVYPSNAGQLQEIADVMFKAKKVIVVTGAGISTNLGIPDFRSENGLYSLIQAQYDAAAAAQKEKMAREELKRSSTSLSEMENISSPDLAGTQTTIASTRLIEKFSIKTRSKSLVESQDARIYTRSQSDIPRRATLQNPEILLRRSASSQSTRSPRLTPKRTASLTPVPTGPASSITSDSISKRPLLKRSRSSESALPKTPTLEAPVPQRSSKRLKLIYHGPSSTPSTSTSSSKDSTPVPDMPEPSSQASITSTSRAVLPKLKGKDLFDAMVWQDPLTTSIFLTFIAELRKQIRTEVVGTSQAHKLIKALRDGGRLVRCYTQNVDGLESREGLRTDLSSGTGKRSRFFAGTLSRPRLDDGSGDNFGGVEVVQLHGGLDALRCSLCGEQSPWERVPAQINGQRVSPTNIPSPVKASSKGSNIPQVVARNTRGNGPGDDGDEEQSDREEVLRGGRAPGCQRCIQADEARQHRGRRSVAVGKLRPDVVLYGEEHPEATRIGELVTHDISLGPDVVLIMGTSLRVHGLKVMVKEFARAAHAKGGKVVFVNNTKPPESTWGDILDYWVEMDCDNWVGDLKGRRGELWLPQGLLVELKKSEDNSAKKTSKQEDPKALSVRKPLPGTPRAGPASKTPKSSTASEPKPAAKRPQCMRDDELNGAYWAYQIQLNLEIIGGRPRSYAPNCNPHRRWGNDKWRRDSGKATSTSGPNSALKLISTNIPRPIKAAPSKGKGNSEAATTSRAAGSQLQRELVGSAGAASRTDSLLPTPPPSDETEEPELPRPMTPRTRARIKSDSSIDRILSSPIGKRSLRSNAQ